MQDFFHQQYLVCWRFGGATHQHPPYSDAVSWCQLQADPSLVRPVALTLPRGNLCLETCLKVMCGLLHASHSHCQSELVSPRLYCIQYLVWLILIVNVHFQIYIYQLIDLTLHLYIYRYMHIFNISIQYHWPFFISYFLFINDFPHERWRVCLVFGKSPYGWTACNAPFGELVKGW